MAFNIREWLDENQAKWPSKWTPGIKQPEVRGRRKIQGKRTITDRAREYLAKIDGAVEGQGGSKKTFYVACQLVNGFDLSIDEARPLIMEWNAKCQPEWNERDIDHKLEDAAKSDHDKPAGHLLEDRPRKIHRAAVRPGNAPAEQAAQGKGVGRVTGENGDAAIIHNADQPVDDEIIANPPGDGVDYDDNRPEIEVTSDEHIVDLEVFSIITEDPRIFQRGGILVEDIRSTKEQKRKISNNLGSFDIVPISLAKLRHLIGQNVRFFKMVPYKDEDGEVDYKKVYIHTPEWCVKTIHGWGGYPGFKALEGIMEIPILHADGSIFDNPGYDPETRMIYEPSGEFPKIDDNPSKESAEQAAIRLFDLVCDFPWEEIDNDKGSTHKSSWLAALMTVMFRHLVDGCCPAFLFSANIAGSGKSKLADIISMIATGRIMPRTPYADNEEEMKKSMIAILMEAKPFVLFDNIQNGGSLGGSTIDAVMTSRVYSDRLLCTNKTPKFLVNTVFFATGNQINLKGDSLRRFIIGKLKSPLESPELRPVSEFKIKEKILNYISRNRNEFVVDVLTIMRSYIKSGMPKGNLISMGSYEEWSDTIREAVHWITGNDPAKSQHYLKKEDKQSLERASLLNGWAELPGAEDGLTVLKAIEWLESDVTKEKYGILRVRLTEMNKTGKDNYPAAQTIGRALGMIPDIVINGRYIKKLTDRPGGTAWQVCKIDPKVVLKPEETDEPENISVEGVPF